jgi:hypothetical protein
MNRSTRNDRNAKNLAEPYRRLPDANHLDFIPGIGEISATILTAFIRDIDGSSTPNHLPGYLGARPVADRCRSLLPFGAEPVGMRTRMPAVRIAAACRRLERHRAAGAIESDIRLPAQAPQRNQRFLGLTRFR